VGVTIGELRQLRIDSTEREGAIITPVLRGVGEHYRRLRPNQPAPPEPELLAGIDSAMTGLAQVDSADARRRGLLALTSLRRNLFPGAAPYMQEPAA
jgi:hypothetical protein